MPDRSQQKQWAKLFLCHLTGWQPGQPGQRTGRRNFRKRQWDKSSFIVRHHSSHPVKAVMAVKAQNYQLEMYIHIFCCLRWRQAMTAEQQQIYCVVPRVVSNFTRTFDTNHIPLVSGSHWEPYITGTVRQISCSTLPLVLFNYKTPWLGLLT